MKNIKPLESDEVENYCHRVLEVLFDIKVRAQGFIENLSAYRDKQKAFSSTEFLEMVNDSY